MRKIGDIDIMNCKRNLAKIFATVLLAAITIASLSGASCFGGGGDDSSENEQTETPAPQDNTPALISNFFVNVPAFPLRALDQSRAYVMVKSIYDRYIELLLLTTDGTIDEIDEISTSSSMQEKITERACTLRDGANDDTNDIIAALEDFSSNSTDLEYYQFSFLVWASFSFEYEHVIVEDADGNIREYDPSNPNFKDLCHK